jgi:pimeloyl-ACP methyl ester carboxylesterase
MAMNAGPEVFARQVRALLERPDSRPTLAMIECPALVLCGAEDRLCPPALHAEMAALIPDSVLRMLPDAGHMPSLEQPAAVTDSLLELLER